MMPTTYPAHGWATPGDSVQWYRDDQGKDWVSRTRRVQAPGSGVCVAVGSDRPFPNGFGPAYPIVLISDGPFAGHEWYIGHNTSNVRVGEHFSFGHILSFANQGINFQGSNGGWIELGTRLPDGRLGPNTQGAPHWFTSLLMQQLVVPDPPLIWGDSGLRVLGMSSQLRDCGWLSRPYWRFNRPVHGAVVAFQRFHHLRVDGVVGTQTAALIKQRSDWCKKHHKKEH